MNLRMLIAMGATAACLGLGACGKGEPKGQVVARVGKDEVTVLDLQTEMQGYQPPNAQARKAAEQQALAQVVQRKVLFQAAKKAKIDRTPAYARQQERVDEALLTRAWQEQLARSVPAPSTEEIDKFIAEHPDLYAQRKKIAIVGMRFNLPNDPSILGALTPLNTLPDVVALLNAKKIAFQDMTGEIDALAVDPRLIEQVMKLKPEEIFVVPQGNVVMVSKVTGMHVEPVAPALAKQHATAYLRNIRTQDAIRRRLGPVMASGLKDVKYNKAYEPPKPAATPAAKGAPAAAPK